MEFIDTIPQFEGAMNAPLAILVLDAQWSLASSRVMETMEHWEQAPQRWIPVPVYAAVTMPDDYHPHVVRWLQGIGLGELTSRGGGEVLWLERGKIIAIAVSGVTAAQVERQASELWSCD
jgi:hypothetical protein